MVGDKNNKTTTKQDNSVELEASLAPAEAEVGAMAKADQYMDCILNNTSKLNDCSLQRSHSKWAKTGNRHTA